VPEDTGVRHDDTDAIFEGSTVMNASHIFDHGLLDIPSSVKGAGRSKDLTDEMLTFREQKGLYFRRKFPIFKFDRTKQGAAGGRLA